MSLTVARFISTTDAQAAAYNALVTGLAATRARLAALRAILDGYNESDNFQGNIDGLLASEAKNVAADRATLLLQNALTGLDTDAAKFGADNGIAAIKDAKSFAQYYQYGEGGPWTCFLAPDWAALYKAINGAAPGAKLIYSPAIADMGHRVVGSPFATGTDVDTSLYAGAAIPKLLVAGSTGTGLVAVTGNGYNATGVPVTGRAWSVNVTGDGTFTLVPAVTGDLLTKATAITIPTGISAGTLTVQAAIPSGRTNPPV